MKQTRWWPRTLCSIAIGVASSNALAAGADLQTATAEEKATAGAHYGDGMRLFQEGDATGALREFQLSYDTVNSPNSHLMVGKLLIDLGRYVEAHRELSVTIEEAKQAEALDPKYAQTRQAAEEELERVEAQVVRLSVSVSGAGESARVRVNDTEYSPEELDEPLVLAPGPLQVSLLDNGATLAQHTLEGRAGESLNVSLEPTAEPVDAAEPRPAAQPLEKQPFPHRRETAYVAGGLGVAGALTFGVFGLLNHGKYSDLQDRCEDNLCNADQRSDADRGHTYQVLANIGLVVGVVGLGSAVALVLTEDESEKQASQRSATQVNIGLGRVSVRGSF